MCEQTESGAENGAFDIAGLCRLSELSPQPMIAVEGATHIVRYLNDAFGRLVSKPRAELIGRPFAQAVSEGEKNGGVALFDRVYRTGKPEILTEQEHSQCPPLYWSYSAWPILGADDLPVGVMIQVTDATEVAIFRAQAVAMNERLLLSRTRQHELTEIAECAGRLKDEFLATLSHELRTPLTVVLGWADTLADPSLAAEDARRAVEIIRRNARLQVKMIDDLLDVARILTGKLRLSVHPLDLGALIAASVEGLKPAAQAKQIGLELQVDANAGEVLGDAQRLQQSIGNLLSNAIKFTPQGGRVRIALERVGLNGFGSHLEMTVSDTGIGIAPEFLPHVFDRFRQGDASITRAFGGLGLGLSIVRQLAELHGGTVRAKSAGAGLGSSFSLRLPQLVPRETK